jgi:hypothetical protein
MRFNLSRTALFAAAILVGLGSRATGDTILDFYLLGEADAGAMAGHPGNATTIDSGPGAHNLASSGSPTYSSNVAAPGSSLSMAFNGSSGYTSANVLTTATTNVGIDAWIYPTVGNVTAPIAYNGNGGGSGYGLFEAGPANGFFPPTGFATVIALVGGIDYGPSVNVPLNKWSEVTQILTGGQNELFLNGSLVGTKSDLANVPSGNFQLGSGLTGNIDQVRVFTGSAFPSPVPEPASLVLFGLSAAGLFAVVRHRRRA